MQPHHILQYMSPKRHTEQNSMEATGHTHVISCAYLSNTTIRLALIRNIVAGL